MPSGAIHLCVAKKVASNLKVNESMEFFIGSVAPDSWRNSTATKIETHFIDEPNSFDYNYEIFFDKYFEQLNNDFVFGYLVHLITDKYWHSNNFITTIVKKDEYPEFYKACSYLISKYGIQKLDIPNNLENIVEELDLSGVQKTLDYLNEVNYLEDKSSVINTDELQERIEETASFVISEIVRLQKGKKKNNV